MNWKVVIDLGGLGIVSFDTPIDPTDVVSRGVLDAAAKNQHFVVFRKPDGGIIVPLAHIQKIIITKEEDANAENSHDH